MTGIPLVNTNSVNDINTSIIAIKKEMKSSGETEVNVNVNLPDTAIPVDEVTSGNMHSVTSNAVANAIKKEYIVNNGDTLTGSGKYDLIKCGNVMELNIYNLSYASSVGNITPVIIPAAYRPTRPITVVGCYGSGGLASNSSVIFLINPNGGVDSYTYSDFVASGQNNLHAVWTV